MLSAVTDRLRGEWRDGARVGSGGRARGERGGAGGGGGGDFLPRARQKLRAIFRSNFLPEKWASNRCSPLWRDDDARAREGGSGARVGGAAECVCEVNQIALAGEAVETIAVLLEE